MAFAALSCLCAVASLDHVTVTYRVVDSSPASLVGIVVPTGCGPLRHYACPLVCQFCLLPAGDALILLSHTSRALP